MTDRIEAAIREVLAGRRRGVRCTLLLAGPAVVSIAYVDPGNYATNIRAGASYGYALFWAVAMASLIALLFQALSAKLGTVTGRRDLMGDFVNSRLTNIAAIPGTAVILLLQTFGVPVPGLP